MAAKPIIVAGVVRGPAGEQVAQARVFIARGPVPVPDIAALTDAEGRFTLSFPVQGSCEMACVAEGYAPSSTTIEVADDRDLRVELRLTSESDWAMIWCGTVAAFSRRSALELWV